MIGFSLNSLDLTIKSWDDTKDKILHSKTAFLIYFPILIGLSASNVRFHSHIPEFSLSDADGFSILPDLAVLY